MPIENMVLISISADRVNRPQGQMVHAVEPFHSPDRTCVCHQYSAIYDAISGFIDEVNCPSCLVGFDEALERDEAWLLNGEWIVWSMDADLRLKWTFPLDRR